MSGSTKFCRYCGEEIPVDSEFCEKCGKILTDRKEIVEKPEKETVTTAEITATPLLTKRSPNVRRVFLIACLLIAVVISAGFVEGLQVSSRSINVVAVSGDVKFDVEVQFAQFSSGSCAPTQYSSSELFSPEQFKTASSIINSVAGGAPNVVENATNSCEAAKYENVTYEQDVAQGNGMTEQQFATSGQWEKPFVDYDATILALTAYQQAEALLQKLTADWSDSFTLSNLTLNIPSQYMYNQSQSNVYSQQAQQLVNDYVAGKISWDQYIQQTQVAGTLTWLNELVPESVSVTNYAVDVHLSLDNQIPIEILGATGQLAGQSFDVNFGTTSCSSQCSLNTIITLPFRGSPPETPIKPTLSIDVGIPEQWGFPPSLSFRFGTIHRTIGVTLEIIPSTESVGLATS